MVHVKGLRVLVILAVVHGIFSQQRATLNSQVSYRNVEHRSYKENVKLSSYGHQMPQQITENQMEPGTTETRIIKHPDEKIVHHPSPIYVKRPPTFVTINHPDIVIEPNPVVYHKPAAVIRSPVIYKNLPQNIQYRHVVKHIVKPVERKVVIEEKQPPHIFTQESITNRKQHILQPKYILTQQSDCSNDAKEFVETQPYNRRSTTKLVYQQNVRSAEGPQGEVVDDSQQLDLSPIYYKQSFPSSFRN